MKDDVEDDIEEWIKVVEAVIIFAGGWIGYGDSPDPDIVDKKKKIFRQTAIALKEKSKSLLSKELLK